MLNYIIVGSGYRAEYFGRIAKTCPDLFRALFLCRSEAKKALMTAEGGLPPPRAGPFRADALDDSVITL